MGDLIDYDCIPRREADIRLIVVKPYTLEVDRAFQEEIHCLENLVGAGQT